MIIDIPEPPPPLDVAATQAQPGTSQFHTFYASADPPAYEVHETQRAPRPEKGGLEAPTRDSPSALSEPTSAAPEASSSQSPESKSLFSFRKSSNQARSASDSPSTPPPSFSRAPSPHCSYPPFPHTYLISTGRNLDNGFPILPPPSDLQPHPFVSHDVNEGDWVRFLDDLKKAASPSTGMNIATHVLPVAQYFPILGGMIARPVYGHLKKVKIIPPIKTVDQWNHHFFRPRRIEVILTKGQQRLSTGSSFVPSLNQGREESRRQQHGASQESLSSDSSSSSSSHHAKGDHNQTRNARHEARRAKKAERRLRKAQRTSGVTPTGELWGDKTYRLFVVSI